MASRAKHRRAGLRHARKAPEAAARLSPSPPTSPMTQNVQPFGVLYFPPPPPNHPGAGYPGANRLSLVPVRDVLQSRDVEWVNAADSCVDAAKLMRQRNVGLLPVKDGTANYLVGVITDRDLITRVAAKSMDPSVTRVANAMTAPILAMVYEDADLMAAERLMIEKQVRRLLVLHRRDNAVCGVLSVDDLARAGQRRRAGEVIRGAAMLASDPMAIGGKIPSATLGEVAAARTDEEVHSSIFKVQDVMGGAVECVRETDACSVAAEKMLARSVGCLPVCSATSDDFVNRLVGIVTDRDIVVRAIAAGLPLATTMVSDVMSRNVACCYADDNLADAEKLMLERCVRRLPVLRRQGSDLVGMLSVDDIAISASRGRAGRVIEHAAAKPNEVYAGVSVSASALKA